MTMTVDMFYIQAPASMIGAQILVFGSHKCEKRAQWSFKLQNSYPYSICVLRFRFLTEVKLTLKVSSTNFKI